MTNFKTVNPIFIGFTGYKQSGKDTSAALLFRQLPHRDDTHYIPESFAGGVYAKVAEAFAVTVKHLKEVKTSPLVRHCLQWAGTEDGRDVHGDDVWIDALQKRVSDTIVAKKRNLVFITDVRFKNEAEFVKLMGGSIIKVERKGLVNKDTHRSEIDIDHISQDWTLHNENISDLERNVIWIAGHIKERYGL